MRVSSGVCRTLMVLLIVSSLCGSAVVVATDGAADTQKNATNYGLDELRSGGTNIAGAAPSLRWLGSDAAVYVDRPYSNPLKSSGDEDWRVEKLLRSGETVHTNELRLHYQGQRSATERTYTLVVVYWRSGTHEVAQNGTTVTEPAAVNQTVEHKEITFSSGFDTASVDLRGHYDHPVHVTMWVQGHGDTARWTFTHKSLATAQTVTTQTAGERLWWLVKNYAIWIILFGLVGAAGSLWAVKRAGRGPGLGLGTWAFLIALVSFGAVMWNYNGVASLFVKGPKILALVTVALLTIPWVESQEDRLQKILFVRPVVTDAVSASGDAAKDAVYLELAEHTVAELADGTLSIVKAGPLKFLARVLGGSAPLQGARDMAKTEVRADGSTKHDRVVWVDPDVEEIVDYAPESIALRKPSSTMLQVGGVALGLLIVNHGWLHVGPLSWLAWVGLGIVGLSCFRVRSGHAKVEPASAHQRSAHVTTMLVSKEMDDAATLDDARKETYKERAKSSKDVEEVVELRDDTLLKEMLGLDIGAAIKGDDSADSGPATGSGAPSDD
ncbi:hypothetical protein NKF26_12120 [Haladaptatus sp. AB618]|uniref:hypothetical protein n=1 Tax=Haladaptatus sp. AB618 TaxID=2934173 RepID=UPI00209BFC81|nr:hypothetical protein [Haladaptatus sp. AB618]MCO8254549.1 hypothetical protein [Haladaptatus sp. AB618]